jgi:hypothetical protein
MRWQMKKQNEEAWSRLAVSTPWLIRKSPSSAGVPFGYLRLTLAVGCDKIPAFLCAEA